MIALTTQFVIVLLTATLIPSTFAFTYPMYNYQRASRAGNYQYDQAQPTYYNGYRRSYDQNEPDNYYVNERNVGQATNREYYYGKPTYHGEYKPTRYYYAKTPNYNYMDDHHTESENPLDDLQEEMLQEDQRDITRHMPIGQPQWFQNTGQPKSLTDNFIKNLMLYNNNDGYNPIERQSESIPSNEYNNNDDIDDIDDTYETLPYDGNFQHEYANGMSSSSLLGQHTKHTKHTKHTFNDEPNQSYDYYDSLMENRPGYLTSSITQNQNDHDKYFDNGNQDELTYADYVDEPKVDKEEQDLKSLRKQQLSTYDSSNNEKFDPFAANMKLSPLESQSTFSTSKSGFEAGHKDYDGEEDGPWINWDRKRSLKQQQNDEFGPLKELEYRLTSLQKHDNELNQLKMPTTTSPPSTTTFLSRLSNSKTNEHKGQKEIFLSRPATPVRYQFSDSVLDALMMKSSSNSEPSLKTVSTFEQQKINDTDEIKTANKNWYGTKKMKRFISNEASLVQQLNGLKGKIKA